MTEDFRLQIARQWLESIAAPWSLRLDTLRPASNDASFRRYFRIDTGHSARPSVILMDAPPPMEDCGPFVHAARVFADAGVTVPELLAEDLSQGLLLLGDFGADTYLEHLDAERAPQLYRDATAALVRLQSASRPDVFPDYDRALLLREMQLYPEWYVERHKGVELTAADRRVLDDAFELIVRNNLAQPRVFVHRDYHSRNLMVLEPQRNPGMLDFQDAVYGPITYDLVSLLRDAYVEWDEEQVLDWAIRYWQQARKAGLPVAADFADFYRDFEWMGLQRHLKVLGIFARLSHRDGKDRYLADLPLVLKYVAAVVGRYNALTPLARLIDRIEARESRPGFTF